MIIAIAWAAVLAFPRPRLLDAAGPVRGGAGAFDVGPAAARREAEGSEKTSHFQLFLESPGKNRTCARGSRNR